MVASVTNHDWDYIMRKLPYAKGLQARTIWYEKNSIAWKSVGDNEDSLKKIIQ